MSSENLRRGQVVSRLGKMGFLQYGEAAGVSLDGTILTLDMKQPDSQTQKHTNQNKKKEHKERKKRRIKRKGEGKKEREKDEVNIRTEQNRIKQNKREGQSLLMAGARLGRLLIHPRQRKRRGQPR